MYSMSTKKAFQPYTCQTEQIISYFSQSSRLLLTPHILLTLREQMRTKAYFLRSMFISLHFTHVASVGSKHRQNMGDLQFDVVPERLPELLLSLLMLQLVSDY